MLFIYTIIIIVSLERQRKPTCEADLEHSSRWMVAANKLTPMIAPRVLRRRLSFPGRIICPHCCLDPVSEEATLQLLPSFPRSSAEAWNQILYNASPFSIEPVKWFTVFRLKQLGFPQSVVSAMAGDPTVVIFDTNPTSGTLPAGRDVLQSWKYGPKKIKSFSRRGRPKKSQ